ncbi:MAG: hypothetical protein AAGI11_04380 [Pseudomonadota bacterium]
MSTRDDYIAALRRAVEANDTAAANEIAMYIDQNLPSPADLRKQDFESMSPWQQMAVGAGETVAELGTGIRNLIPEAVRQHLPEVRINDQPVFGDETAANLAMTTQDRTGWKTAGKVGADIAMTAVPAAKAAQGATLRQALAREAALMGGYAAAKQPEEGASRAGNAALAAGATAAAGAAVPLATGAITGAGRKVLDTLAPVSDDAARMLDDGVQLTPGMARPNLAPAEKVMSRVPGVAGPTQQLQGQALEDWNRQILNQVTPGGGITKSGVEGFKQAKAAFSKAYGGAWGKAPRDVKKLMSVEQQLAGLRKQLSDVTADNQPLAKKTLASVQSKVEQFRRTGKTGYLESADDTLRDARSKAVGSPDVDFFEGLRKRFHNAVPEDVRVEVQAIDRQYRDFITAARASAYVDAQEAGGRFTGRQLAGASKARSSDLQTATGRGSLQQEAARASRVMTPPAPRMNASELEESAAPLLTAAAATVAPVGTATALGVGRTLVNDSARRALINPPGFVQGAQAVAPASAVGGAMTSHLFQTPDRQAMMADALRASMAEPAPQTPSRPMPLPESAELSPDWFDEYLRSIRR